MEIARNPKKATMANWAVFLVSRGCPCRNNSVMLCESWERQARKGVVGILEKNNVINGMGFVWWELERYRTRRGKEESC